MGHASIISLADPAEIICYSQYSGELGTGLHHDVEQATGACGLSAKCRKVISDNTVTNTSKVTAGASRGNYGDGNYGGSLLNTRNWPAVVPPRFAHAAWGPRLPAGQ